MKKPSFESYMALLLALECAETLESTVCGSL